MNKILQNVGFKKIENNFPINYILLPIYVLFIIILVMPLYQISVVIYQHVSKNIPLILLLLNDNYNMNWFELCFFLNPFSVLVCYRLFVMASHFNRRRSPLIQFSDFLPLARKPGPFDCILCNDLIHFH